MENCYFFVIKLLHLTRMWAWACMRRKSKILEKKKKKIGYSYIHMNYIRIDLMHFITISICCCFYFIYAHINSPLPLHIENILYMSVCLSFTVFCNCLSLGRLFVFWCKYEKLTYTYVYIYYILQRWDAL